MQHTNRKYGVEIEFLGNSAERYGIAQAITNAGVTCSAEDYNHTTRSAWKLITDGSCGLELVSPPLSGESGFREIEIVCRVLDELGRTVNKTCGLHVHHDASDFVTAGPKTFAHLLALMLKWEPVLDALVAPSRRDNQYCMRAARVAYANTNLRFASVHDALEHVRRTGVRIFEGTRYAKLNLASFGRHGTVEFRQHQGTLSADKIIWWVILTQSIVERAVVTRSVSAEYDDNSISFKRFSDWIGLTGTYVQGGEYVRKAARMTKTRFREFNPDLDVYAPIAYDWAIAR